jgi:hypothetical protein
MHAMRLAPSSCWKVQATNREHERSHICSLSSNSTSRQVFRQKPYADARTEQRQHGQLNGPHASHDSRCVFRLARLEFRLSEG